MYKLFGVVVLRVFFEGFIIFKERLFKFRLGFYLFYCICRLEEN